jgi:rhodanese-related sulfurtransferase
MPLPREIPPADVQAARAADPALPYVDVRSATEFAAGHPPGAANVPLFDFDPRRGLVPNPRFLEVMRAVFPKDRALVVGCASGGRSRQAQQLLLQDGYADVANMIGGFQGGQTPAGPVLGWSTSGLPVAKDGRTYADLLRDAGL